MSAQSTLSSRRLTAQRIVAQVPKVHRTPYGGTLCAILRIAIVILTCSCSVSVFAGPVYTYGGEFNLRIPADPNSSKGLMYDAIINISEHFTIYDLDVGISLTHSNIFDLKIFLESPSGTKVCLNMYDVGEYFNGEDYIDTIFDDEADIPIEMAEPQFTGNFRPKQLLSAFDGEDTYGLWRLQIYDAYYADTGSLDNFNIIVTILEPATAVLLIVGLGLATLFRPRS
jgi:subtilisin-like proprotein convertase family protein